MTNITPLQKDVLFGRGYAISAHPGNQTLRTMVRVHKPIFLQKKKTEKRDVARKIVNDVLKLGGRFLIEDPNNYANAKKKNDREGIYEKAWICVEVEKAVVKVMHRLREKDKSPIEENASSHIQMDGQLQSDPNVLKKNNSQSSFTSSEKSSHESSVDPDAAAIFAAGGASPSPFDAASASALLNAEQIDDFFLTIDLEVNDIDDVYTAEGGGENPSQLAQKVSDFALNSSVGSMNGTGQTAPHQTTNQVRASDGSQANPHLNQTALMNGLAQHPVNPSSSEAVCVPGLSDGSQSSPDWAQISNQQIESSPELSLMSAQTGIKPPPVMFPIHPTSALGETSKMDKSNGVYPLKGDLGNPGREDAYCKNSLFFMEASNPIKSFPISAQEFLKSGGMSCQIMLAQDNVEASMRQDKTVGGLNKQHQQRITENSARLALLLTRLYVDQLPGMDATSIALDDFFIFLEDNVHSVHVNDAGSPTSVLLRMDMSTSAKTQGLNHQQNYSQFPAMQILGKLLYRIFSLGESPAPDLLANPKSSSERKAVSTAPQDEDIIERLFKSSRTMDASVFSRLAEGGVFPISICRLLSDMMDISPKGEGKSDKPFKSFEDVMKDLEQMLCDPQKFLHDSPPPLEGSQQQAMFGQASYGRTAEVSCLAGVATRMMQSLNQPNMGLPQSGVEAVFVSGIAGSGKSHLVDEFGNAMSSSGWLVIKGKFERGLEHISRRIVSSIFDQVVSYIVKMKESGRKHDVVFSQQASKLILDSIGMDRMSSLVDFLPSLSSLFGGIARVSSLTLQTDETEWRLIYSMSKILESVLESGRFVMICCDDLQWSDKTSLTLISEILVNLGSIKHASRRCLFAGSFRQDEINDQHPFSIQYAYLQMMTSNINTTKIEISSLSKNDVGEMLMAEFQLPHRYVRALADVVHKKTSGHAIFVVELLNKLLRDSIIAYTLQKRRYAWDQDTVSFIRPGEGVAGLIASNLKSLPPASQQVLRVLSMFGTQTDVSLLQLLERIATGIISSLELFVEMGILDRAGPIIMFSHDLIQQSVYESIPLAERQALHLDVGKCLASADPMTIGMSHLHLENKEFFGGGRSMTSSLISLACDQIDSVGPNVIVDEEQRIQFAKWNLAAGKQAYRQSNPNAAFHYCSNGIAFLGPNCWQKNRHKLCLELHVGAVKAAFTLGEPDNVSLYAEKLTANASFDDSMEIQPLVLMSLSSSGKHEESIFKGLSLLRKLNFDLPPAPTPESVMHIMATTDGLASKFTADQLMNLCEKNVDETVHRVLKVMDAFYTSCYASSSPFLPLVACVIIQFSCQHGICMESTVAFATFGMLKIFLAGDYAGGLYWAGAVRNMEKKLQSMSKSKINRMTHAPAILHLACDIWFQSPREISRNLVTYQQDAINAGQLHLAMIAVGLSSRYLLLGGENLSLLTKSYTENMKMVAKHSTFVAKYLALDSLLLTTLTGKPGDYFSALGDSICNMRDLQDEAKSTRDMTLLQSSHVFNVMIEFWQGNYMAAEEHSRLASMMIPASKEPTIYLIYHIFFRGLILFHLHRMLGDDQRLNEGKEMMNTMGKWAQNSMDVFANKWLLLKAEFHASVNDHSQAVEMYQGSIKSAQDHGNIHELALSHELLGNYYLGRGEEISAFDGFKKAYIHYTQWGANAMAQKILHKHNLDMLSVDKEEVTVLTQKHLRGWD